MFNRKVLPIVLLMCCAGVFWAYKSQGENGKSFSTQQKILTSLAAIIEENHYSPKPINDNFSKEVFKRFLVAVDPDKNIFLKSDINKFKKYETTIDDEIHGASIQLLPEMSKVYNQRSEEVHVMVKQILSTPFDFTIKEEVNIDSDKLDFVATEAQQKDTWRKKLKYLTLERYSDLLEQQSKFKGSKDSIKTNEELEKEARLKVSKIMDKSYERIKLKFTDDERFNLFINTITTYIDPHSDYFPPVEKRSFEEQLSGKFYGIGASLRDEEGTIKVVSLITGSPAWKSGEVLVGDVVMKVAQGNNEPTDLSGYAVDDAVKIIRGNKGTEVRLTLKKQDGTVKVVSLIRDEIVLDEVYVRSAIINGDKKIGYIYLPDFYADYEKPNGARCARDVARELVKLKSENVQGVIIDLRYNGGGYLREVVDMVGLFIPDGPVVQVKDRDGKPTMLLDTDRSVIYDGPLTVLINEFSASASEIFAAAIQDYGRGLVIGSSTYGKGTVQQTIPFGKPLDFISGRTEYGAIKLTLQKYYRINGGSTQLKGVSPDISLPDNYDFLKVRERDNVDAMPWDEIARTTYKKWDNGINIEAIKVASQERIQKNVNFSLIKNNAQWLSKQNDKVYSLKLDDYKAEQKTVRETVKQNTELSKLTVEMPFEGLKADDAKYNNVDKDKGERYKAWLKNLKTDIYINEASNILKDMISSTTVKVAQN